MTDTIDNGNPTPAALPDEWTPVRSGAIYCSPACGSKCTHEAFEYAKAGAAALVAELGAGWMPRLWENGDWYFEAKKGAARVSYDQHAGEFEAEVCIVHAGRQSQQFFGNASTPRRALEDAIEQLEAVIAAMTRTKLSVGLESLAVAAPGDPGTILDLASA